MFLLPLPFEVDVDATALQSVRLVAAPEAADPGERARCPRDVAVGLVWAIGGQVATVHSRSFPLVPAVQDAESILAARIVQEAVPLIEEHNRRMSPSEGCFVNAAEVGGWGDTADDLSTADLTECLDDLHERGLPTLGDR